MHGVSAAGRTRHAPALRLGWRRTALAVSIAVLAFALFALVTGTSADAAAVARAPAVPSCSIANVQSASQAGLVIVFDGGRTVTRCLSFSGDDITGAELLRRSGLDVVFSSFGGLGAGVCRIDGVGCADPDDCFCQCSGAQCQFWAYFGYDDGRWRFQNIGPSQRRLRDGDVDAWVWGTGRQPPSTGPGACAQDRPPATATPRPPAAQPTGLPSSNGPPAPQGELQSNEGAAAPTARPLTGDTDTLDPASTARPTARAPTPTGDPAVRRAPPGGASSADAAPSASERGSGAPAGLIAFGAVAGALALVGGAAALRRRRGG